MSEKGPRLDSRNWTGDPASPTAPKPPSSFQMKVILALSLFASCYSVWAIIHGFSHGQIQIPLQKWHRWVPMQDHIAFAACVLGWSLTFGIAALGTLGACACLRKRTRP